MNKKFLIHLISSVFSTVFILFALSSCEKDSPTMLLTVDDMYADDMLADVHYNIIEENVYTVEEMANLLYGPEGEDPDIADIRRQFIENSNQPNDDYDKVFSTEFKIYKYEYYSKDQLGYSIKLSAFMSVGAWGLGHFFTDQDNLYLICPYTHTLESECATKDNGGYEYMFFMCRDNMFIMPDGQGFGSNAGNVQPYVDHNTQAQQIYDAMKAGYNLYRDKGGLMEKNWKLRVIGASQGGGDAMAVHKLLDTQYETHSVHGKEYTMLAGDWWNFDYSYVCCGPYCPEATMKKYTEWGKVTYPCVIPLVIKSMLACNRELAQKYDETDFYSGLWNENKEDFDRIYRDKTKNTDDLNSYICKKLGVKPPEVPLKTMLSDAMNNPKSQIYKDLIACLKKQDLTTGWTPKTRTYVYFCASDEVVPYTNSYRLMELFGDNCKAEHSEWESHVGVCRQFMFKSW